MKTYECIVHSGNTGNQIIVFVRAYSVINAKTEALIISEYFMKCGKTTNL